MTFGAPQFLYLLAALPALGVFVWWALSRRGRAVGRIGDPALVQRLSLAAGRRVRGLTAGPLVSGRGSAYRRPCPPPVGQRHPDCRAGRCAGHGRPGHIPQYARSRPETHPPRPRQAGNFRPYFAAGRGRSRHRAVLRRQLHPVSAHFRPLHGQDLPESCQPQRHQPPGHSDRRSD